MFDLENRIKPYMSDYRYRHTLSVVSECRSLAKLFDIDEKKLVIAAYLHDITKEMPENEQILLCEKAGIILDESTLNSPKTLHAFSAPVFIEKNFPEFADEEVLNAVKYHTTGRADMSLIEKLLYLADYIEPTRKFDDCKKIRDYFYKDLSDPEKSLDDAIFLSLRITIEDLIARGKNIHIETVKAYNNILSK